MAKPIFIIGFPGNISQEFLEKHSNGIKDKLEDYHVLLYITNLTEPKFQVFYDKDIEEKKIEEIQKMIMEKISCGNLND